MVSIKEIARLASVCPATVSRVLRHPELVSEQKRDVVMEVIRQTGYVPNTLGVNLRNSRTQKLMAIVPDVISAFNNPVIRTIENIAYENNYSVLLGDTQGQEAREKSFAAMARSREVDGILLFCRNLPFTIDPGLPLASQLPPMVHACETTGLEGVPKVNIDNAKAAEDGCNYLLSLGHKRIAVIGGHCETPSTVERVKGYRRALDQAGIAFDESLVVWGNYAMRESAQATRRLMARSEKPSAIFALSDEMAMSCLATLYDMGVRVPDEVSVMGFDGIAYGEFCCPTLTTVAQPLEEYGAVCMELLLPQLRGESMSECSRILQHELVIRKSTGPAPT